MKKILLLIVLSLTLVSCDKWLEVKPKTQVRAEDMFGSYKGFRDVLTGCYVKMNKRTVYGEYMTMSAIESMAQLWSLDGSTNFPVFYPLSKFDYTNTNAQTALKSVYGDMFNIIVQANTVLKNISKNGEVIGNTSTRSLIEGEALAIRAFLQLDILRLFGQLPKNGTTQVMLPYVEEVSNNAPSYLGYDAYIQKVESDLLRAEELLHNNDPLFKHSFAQLCIEGTLEDDFLMYRQFRFNYYAVKALQARFYLYTQQNIKAYNAAKAVLEAKNTDGSKLISLATQQDYDNGGYALPSECLIALSNYDLQDYVPSLLGGINGSPILNTTLSLTRTMYQNLFAGFQTSLRNTHTWNSSTVLSLSSTVRPSIRKYQSVADKSTIENRIIPIIRLSEIYLIAMETAELSEANTLYTQYMAARNVLATTPFSSKELLKTALLSEYRREFYAEGQMFFTYKRNASTQMVNRTEAVAEKHYLVPLPETEYNPNL